MATEEAETAEHATARSGGRTDFPPANVGRLLLSAFELFADGIVSGIRERGFPEFRYSDTQVLRNLDPEGTRITALAERARMTKQAMSELVRRLERDGFVERRPDPEDGRAKRVQMTEKGRDVTEAAQQTNREVVESWSESLGREELQRLLELLSDLLQSQEALPRFPDPLDW